MELFGLPAWRGPRSLGGDATPDCAWCGVAESAGSFIGAHEESPFGCVTCIREGRTATPPGPRVSRETTPLLPERARPEIGTVQLEGREDPLAGLEQLGRGKPKPTP